MQKRSRQLLEFSKVLNILAGFAVSEAGALACTAIKPIADPKTLARTGELTRQFIAFSAETDFSFASFPALDSFFTYLHHKPLSEECDQDTLWAVLQVLLQAKAVLDALNDVDTDRWPALAELADIHWPSALWAGLRRCLGSDGLLKDEASPELYLVRQSIRDIHQRCSKKVKGFIEGEGIAPYMQGDYITIRGDRYVLPLKATFKRKLPGIIHDYSQTGETCYFEPMFLVDMNNELQGLKQEERAAEKAVRMMLFGLLVQNLEVLQAVYRFLVEMDVLSCKAVFASHFQARVLDMGPDMPVCLYKAKHPLLSESGVVPTDIILESGQKALIITGGNAGGKSVALKTLGLLALMAQSGLPVCVAEGSCLPLWEKIFVLLGDEQSIENALSTFTAQVEHFVQAYTEVDSLTLVIMDEFGAGTDPSQGAALAQAVVDGLLEKGAWLALVTHFPALKAYALMREGVRAASVLFDPATKKPLYTLAYDQVGASQALQVAAKHGMPESIIEKARKYMLLDGTDSSLVMERLNALAVKREEELFAVKKEQEKLREKRLKFREEYAREQKKALAELTALSQDIVKNWKKERITRKQALKELSSLRRQVAAGGDSDLKEETAQTQKALMVEDVKQGMRLLHTGLDREGVVLAVNERKSQVKLDTGGVSMWADVADVAPLEKGKKDKKSVAYTGSYGSGGGMSLDVRGMRADEIEGDIHKFLDRAVLSGRNELEIIHGRGTGALRKEVRRILKASVAVDTFFTAAEDRGGDGMTIVTLK